MESIIIGLFDSVNLRGYIPIMETPKRRAGRPKKYDGEPSRVRLVLYNGEKEALEKACEATGLSQHEFARAAVLHAIDVVGGVRPARTLPKKMGRS